jgi:hypothetical protein
MSLLRRLLAVANGQGARTMACSVHSQNEVMVKVIQSLGFQLGPDDGSYLLASRAFGGEQSFETWSLCGEAETRGAPR